MSNVLVVYVWFQIYCLIDHHCKTSIRNLWKRRKCPNCLTFPQGATSYFSFYFVVSFTCLNQSEIERTGWTRYIWIFDIFTFVIGSCTVADPGFPRRGWRQPQTVGVGGVGGGGANLLFDKNFTENCMITLYYNLLILLKETGPRRQACVPSAKVAHCSQMWDCDSRICLSNWIKSELEVILDTLAVADLGGLRVVVSPQSNCFNIFIQFLAKSMPNYKLGPPCVWHPPLGNPGFSTVVNFLSYSQVSF